MRKLILKAHLYLTLVSGLFVLVVTVTGAALVFHVEIDDALNRPTSYVAPRGAPLPLETLVAHVAAAFPDRALDDVVLAERPDRAYSVRMAGKGAVAALVNPYTAEILGRRDFAEANLGRGLARTIYLLHTRLMAGRIGEYLVGAITVATLLILFSGLYLWWRRKIVGVLWKSSWKRVNFDLHNVFGFYAAIFLVFVTLSGVVISFEPFTDPLIKSWFNGSPEIEPPKRSTTVAGQRISLDEAMQRADLALPGAKGTIISIPSTPSAVFRITKRFPEDRAGLGRSRVYIDQYSGKVLYVKSTRADQLGTKILNIKRAVHTGDLFGWPTRILAFLACLFLLGQIVTGVLIWWKKIQPSVRSEP